MKLQKIANQPKFENPMNKKRVTILSTLACGAFVAAVAPAQAAVLITPVGVTASSEYDPDYVALNLINNSGLSGTAPYEITDIHGEHVGTTWYTEGALPQTLTFDLGGLYTLSNLHIWQYTHSTHNWAKDITVAFSTTGTSGTFGNAVNIQMLNQSGLNQPAENFALITPVNADAVKFTVTSTWEENHYVALAEVKFTGTAIPEPSAALLGAFGLFALLRRRRR
jgi:MYXO-CTERM domain-containing protein